jgi:hypothetical protein
VDLWATFPGRLTGILKTGFKFFSIDSFSNSDSNKGINLLFQNESLIMDQVIAYDNFKFDAKSVI